MALKGRVSSQRRCPECRAPIKAYDGHPIHIHLSDPNYTPASGSTVQLSRPTNQHDRGRRGFDSRTARALKDLAVDMNALNDDVTGSELARIGKHVRRVAERASAAGGSSDPLVFLLESTHVLLEHRLAPILSTLSWEVEDASKECIDTRTRLQSAKKECEDLRKERERERERWAKKQKWTTLYMVGEFALLLCCLWDMFLRPLAKSRGHIARTSP
jgi:hypothetical protein